jgi:hypothetical protein
MLIKAGINKAWYDVPILDLTRSAGIQAPHLHFMSLKQHAAMALFFLALFLPTFAIGAPLMQGHKPSALALGISLSIFLPAAFVYLVVLRKFTARDCQKYDLPDWSDIIIRDAARAV